MPAKSFPEVEVWKKAHAWVLHVYGFTEKFPKHELFGLTSQLRRAAVSIPANFAEGFKKKGHADKARFYNIAQGSLRRVPLLHDFSQRSRLRRYHSTLGVFGRGEQDVGGVLSFYAGY